MTEYSIVIEDVGTNFCAYVLGLDGCIATGQTIEQVEDTVRDALQFHLEGMRLRGDQLASHMPIMKSVQVAS
jgi:predicted RNase H-like HicB family nuclease